MVRQQVIFHLFKGLLLLPILAHAGSPYSDYNSGLLSACPSQGAATQDALALVEKTQSLLRQLRDDENCKGIEPIQSALESLRSNVNRYLNQSGSEARIVQKQAQVEELTRLYSSLPANSTDSDTASIRSSVALSLATARIELAKEMAAYETREAYGSTLRTFGTLPPIQAELSNILSNLSRLEECSAKSPNLVADVIGTLLPAASAIATPAVGIAMDAGGKLLLDLSRYLTNVKYSRRIREMEEINKRSAISCALEKMETSICDAMDGKDLILWRWQNQDPTNSQGRSGWEGYNILVLDLPILTTWIQKLIYGKSAESKPEAQTAIDTDAIENFYRSVTTFVNYKLNEARQDAAGVSDQRNIGLPLLLEMLATMGAFGPRSSEFPVPEVNVFTRTVNSSDLPFFLVGRKQEDFKSSGSILTGIDLIRENRSQLPLNLVDTIARQYKILLEGGPGISNGGVNKELADQLAKRRIADAQLLLMNFVSTTQLNRKSPYLVANSLKEWLGAFVENGAQLGSLFEKTPDPGAQAGQILNTAEDTLQRVSEVIRIWKSTGAKEGKKASDEVLKNVISDIALQLDVARNRDRLLVQRVAELVNLELTKEALKPETPQKIETILAASKEEIYQKIVKLGNDGLTDNSHEVYDSLDNAIDAHKSHASSFWRFFRDDFYDLLKSTTQADRKGKLCAKLLLLPDDVAQKEPELVKQCLETSIVSIKVNGATPPEWKQRLQLKFRDYLDFPAPGSRDSRPKLKRFEDRVCAYRDFRRQEEQYLPVMRGLSVLKNKMAEGARK